MTHNTRMISRRDFLKFSSLSVLGMTTGCSALDLSRESIAAKQPDHPNIIVILVDDMGYSDIGCYGGEINTPNIDALAKDGLRFTQFYNTARCCPTRASLMTGLHPHQTGIGGMTIDPGTVKEDPARPYGYTGYLNRDCVTIGEVLKEAGYHTYMAGKWHLGFHNKEYWPLQRGFDRFYGILAGATSYFKPQGNRGLTLDNEHIEPQDENYYTTDAFTDYAIRFIKEQKDPNPFFLYLAYNAPHWPLHAKKQDIEKYVGKYAKGWDELRRQRHQRQLDMGIVKEQWGISDRDPGVRAWDALTPKQKQRLDYRMAVYAAQIDCMDQNIGKVVQTLKETGKFDNTLILFLSDNGGCAEPYKDLGGGNFEQINDPGVWGPISYGQGWANASNTPFRLFKVRMHEGGISTPLIAHWPARIKEQKGKLTEHCGYLIDIMPTLLEAAGAAYPKTYHGHTIHPTEGISLLPVIETGKGTPHEWMFWEHQDNCAVRRGNWKAIQKFNTGNWELYNIQTDRTERHDLAADNPEIVNELSKAWHEWAKAKHVVPK